MLSFSQQLIYIHILTAFKIVGILHAMEICINLLISICWNDFGVTVFPQMHFISIVPKWIKIYLKNSSYSNYQWCWSTVQFNCFYTCAQINTQHPILPKKLSIQHDITVLSTFFSMITLHLYILPCTYLLQ